MYFKVNLMIVVVIHLFFSNNMYLTQIENFCGGYILNDFYNNTSKRHILDHIDSFFKHPWCDAMPIKGKQGYVIIAYLNSDQKKQGLKKELKKAGFKVISKTKNPNSGQICWGFQKIIGKSYSINRE